MESCRPGEASRAALPLENDHSKRGQDIDMVEKAIASQRTPRSTISRGRRGQSVGDKLLYLDPLSDLQ